MSDIYSRYKRQYSNDPKVWGPSAWRFIHTTALQYPLNPSQKEKEQYKTFFILMPSILPCYQCGQHMMEYIHSNYQQFLRAFDNQESLFRWTVDFHNHVTSMKQRPQKLYQPKRTII